MLPPLLLALAVAIPTSAVAETAPLSPALEAALQAAPGGATEIVWVYLRDKGPQPEARSGEALVPLTARALGRRALRGELRALTTFEDLPLVRGYVDEVARRVAFVRNESRWFNAVSVEAFRDQVESLRTLPFVERLDIVRRYRRPREEPAVPLGPSAAAAAPRERAEESSLDYGTSRGQVAQIHVPEVHDLGLHGEGVVIAVFDAGFSNLAHEVFSSTRILSTRDFVNGDRDVGDGADRGNGDHGTETLSVLGGFKPGELIGPAFAASFLLAKTENTESETPVEEDNWAAAAEWAEAMGADVISSSLGYLEFDGPFTSYTFADMNGATAISTKAADKAAARGVVVVSSAGNQGFNAEHNTLGAPADGRRVLAVAAVTSSGARSDFSSVGPSADGRIKPDVAAQGSAVKAASPGQVSRYVLVSGTSFSCPLTAGVAALLLQAHPNYKVGLVVDLLRNTASQGARPDNLVGWGIVDALAAVRAPALPPIYPEGW